MEQLQIGYVTAVAAAAGCVLTDPRIDEGVDLMATHFATEHTYPPDNKARLEIQLKATYQYAGKQEPDSFAVDMRRDRWDYLRVAHPTIGKIVVIMNMPSDPAEWTMASHDWLSVRHCAYWVNLATLPDSTAQRPLAKAPRDNVFDDIALCKIMARIGQGQAP